MFSFGDVLAVLGIFTGVALTSWATVLAFGLMFEEKSRRASVALEHRPWHLALLGFVILAVMGFIGIALLNGALPAVKVLGLVVIGWLLTIALVGGAGLTESIANRIAAISEEIKPFTARSRAAGILVGSALLPLAGWFVFAPAMLMVCIGAGAHAIFARQSQMASDRLG